MKTEYKFTLNVMVNAVACNDIVHIVSTEAVSIFYKNLIPLKLANIVKRHYIYFITIIKSDYFLWVKRTTR